MVAGDDDDETTDDEVLLLVLDVFNWTIFATVDAVADVMDGEEESLLFVVQLTVLTELHIVNDAPDCWCWLLDWELVLDVPCDIIWFSLLWLEDDKELVNEDAAVSFAIVEDKDDNEQVDVVVAANGDVDDTVDVDPVEEELDDEAAFTIDVDAVDVDAVEQLIIEFIVVTVDVVFVSFSLLLHNNFELDNDIEDDVLWSSNVWWWCLCAGS